MSIYDYIKTNVKSGDIVYVGCYDNKNINDVSNLCDELGRRLTIIGTFQPISGRSSKDILCTDVYTTVDVQKLQKPNHNIIKCNNISIYKNIIELNDIALIYVDLKYYSPTKQLLSALIKYITINKKNTQLLVSFSDTTHGAGLATMEMLNSTKIKHIKSSSHILLNTNCSDTINVPLSNTINNDPVIVATVLKSGGIYTEEYAVKLGKNIRKNCTIPIKLVILTDLIDHKFENIYDNIIPLQHDWPKWWGKIELFSPDFYNGNRVVYFDLDTIIHDNIDDILSYSGDFAALSDFYQKVTLGSGVMAWESGKYCQIYHEFVKNSENIISNYSYGDQQWIQEKIKRPVFLQNIFKNKLVSFKADCIKQRTYTPNVPIQIPKSSSVICFHGEPRIHTFKSGIIQKLWNGISDYYTGDGIMFGKVDTSIQYKNVVIIGSGPSLKDFDFNLLNNLEDTAIICINDSIKYYNKCNIWFTLDPHGLTKNQISAPPNVKLYAAVPSDYGTSTAHCKDHQVVARSDVIYLHRLQSNNYTKMSSINSYRLGLSDDIGCISTGNSGYGALNLAYHLKPNNIILLGIDGSTGYFFDENKKTKDLSHLNSLFESTIPQLTNKNINVINGSENSRITCFPRYTPENAISLIDKY